MNAERSMWNDELTARTSVPARGRVVLCPIGRGVTVLALAASCLGAARVHAASPADYPSRPIRVLVPFAPGGGADTLARIITPRLTEGMGQQWVVDNRGGAGGNIAAET